MAAKTDLVTVTVMVGGSKIPDVYELMQIQVQRQINRIPSAKIMLLDGNPSDETFKVSESDTFVPGNEVEIKAIEADRGSYLGYVRVVGRRQGQVKLADDIVSLPAQYTKKPLLRSEKQ